MTDRLEHINKVLTAQYEALGIIKSVPGVYGVHIVSSIGDPFNYFNYIKTQTPNMRNYYSLSEFENYAKDYCQAHDGCLGSIGGFGDEGCSGCALFEFFMEMKARENPEEGEDEE